MRKLILATESFPYGRGEKTFILPELERLRQYFDITIVSHANREQMEDGICGELPENIKVVCLERPRLSVLDKIKAFFSIFLNRDGRIELKEILQGKCNKGERFYQSLAFYAQAMVDQKKLCKSGILSTEEPIIYYSFWYTYFCYSMIREKSRCPRVSIITRTHGVDLYHERISGGRQPFRHQMETRLDAIVFACEYGEEYYKSHMKDSGTDSGKLHICKLGIEAPNRQMPVGQGEERELLSCSNVIPLKRIPLIVDGLARIDKLKIHWTHIGDGSEMKQLQEYAEQKLGNKANIRYTFAGYVENVRAYYEQNQVDCFITTSETEGGCPVSIQEAMSYGVPIIGTDVGGITEMIADNGILLSADPDEKEIANAIQKIMMQERLKMLQMKEAAYQKWRKEFDINSSFGKIFKIIERLLENDNVKRENTKESG